MSQFWSISLRSAMLCQVGNACMNVVSGKTVCQHPRTTACFSSAWKNTPVFEIRPQEEYLFSVPCYVTFNYLASK